MIILQRVPLRFNKDYPLVLYLAHRATVIGDLKIREGRSSDVAAAEELLCNVPKRSKVLEDLENALETSSSYSAYVFLCQDAVVGFAIIWYVMSFTNEEYRVYLIRSFQCRKRRRIHTEPLPHRRFCILWPSPNRLSRKDCASCDNADIR